MKYFNFEKILYEGSKSSNPLACKQYNPDEKILGNSL